MRVRELRRVAWDGLALAVFLLMIFPIYWMVSTAFKPGREILTLNPVWIPLRPTLDNFAGAIAQPFFWNDVVNSALIVSATVVIAIALAFLAALAVARFRFRGRAAVLAMVIGVQMVPLSALVIPIFLFWDSLELVDTLVAVVLTYLAFVLPFVIWTLRGFIVNVPVEMEEQAMTDGCSRTGAFFRIVFPLVAPGLVATAVYAFIQAWNEYLIAYVLLRSGAHQTVTVWLASFTTSHGTDWGGLMAGATLTGLPVVIFFLALQRYIASGLTAGAVKG